ncbi:twin-arginine translocation signal domain-containing protein [Candidatus Saccharibacteria bacterium]|nr:twin-arginine translocation signal domain-containing protein [Candidatus Saccharibacteria bacterium]
MNRRQFLKFSALTAATGIICSYPVFIERYAVQVNIYKISLPTLPQQFNVFTIVHLTDLHYGPLVQLFFIRYIIGITNSLKKDVTVYTGDYVHKRNTDEEINVVWPVLSELRAPCGVFSVLGNHDHWADSNRSAYWLERSGQNIRNSTYCFEREGKRLWIAGGGDLWEDHKNFDSILMNIPEEDCRIVLADPAAKTLRSQNPKLNVLQAQY